MTRGAGPTPVLQFHRAAVHSLASASLERYGYAADIFHNPHEGPKPWTYILTRQGSPEILYWGREGTLELARDAAQSLLDGFSPAVAAG